MNPEQYWDNEAVIDPRYSNGKWHINLGDDPDEVLLEVLRNIWPHVPETGHVVEIGCGPARLLMPSAMNFPNVKWVGVDCSPNMIALAAPKMAMLPNAAVQHVALEDGLAIMEEPILDLVYMVEVVQHIDDSWLSGYIDWAWHALKPGGKLVFQFVNDLSGRPWEPFSYPRSVDSIRRMVDFGKPWGKTRYHMTSLHPEWTWVVATK